MTTTTVIEKSVLVCCFNKKRGIYSTDGLTIRSRLMIIDWLWSTPSTYTMTYPPPCHLPLERLFIKGCWHMKFIWILYQNEAIVLRHRYLFPLFIDNFATTSPQPHHHHHNNHCHDREVSPYLFINHIYWSEIEYFPSFPSLSLPLNRLTLDGEDLSDASTRSTHLIRLYLDSTTVHELFMEKGKKVGH
jgi:hypothetical protein